MYTILCDAGRLGDVHNLLPHIWLANLSFVIDLIKTDQQEQVYLWRSLLEQVKITGRVKDLGQTQEISLIPTKIELFHVRFQRACATSARGHVQEVLSSSLTSWQ